MNGGGHAEVLADDLHETTIQVPILHPVAIAIADKEQWRRLPGIQCDPVASLEFSLFLTRTAKGLYELPILIELKHVIGAIPIGDKNGVVRPQGYCAGLEPFGIFVNT